MIIKDLNLSFGMQDVFKDVSINIPDNEKIGIVGVNGAGKSTFFKILLKKIEPNSGKILFTNKMNISLLPQVIDEEIPSLDITVFDFLPRSSMNKAIQPTTGRQSSIRYKITVRQPRFCVSLTA